MSYSGPVIICFLILQKFDDALEQKTDIHTHTHIQTDRIKRQLKQTR